MDKQLVLVFWLDAWADDDNFATTHGITATHAPLPVQTLGWLVHEDELGVSIANEHSTADGSDTWRGRTFIPKAMIKDVIPYNLTKPRTKRRAVQVETPQTENIGSDTQ